MLTDAEAAWLACAIDSEGTIALQVYHQRGKETPRVVAYVNVVNTDPRYVDHVEALIRKVASGCHRGVRTRTKPGHLPVLFAAVSNELRVRPVLESVAPWLIIKRDRAEALLTYFSARAEIRSQWRGRRGSAPYGDELQRLYEDFYGGDAVVNPRRRIGHGN